MAHGNSVGVRSQSQASFLQRFKSGNVKTDEKKAINQVVYGHAENAPSSRVFSCVPNDGVLDLAGIIVQQRILPKGDSRENSVGDDKGSE